MPQIGVGATKQEACSGRRTMLASASAVIGFRYSGFQPGVDVALEIVKPDGTPVTGDDQFLPHGPLSDSSGCLGFTLTADQATLPVGTYQVQMFAGPSLTPVSPAVALTITAPATPQAGDGSSTGAGN